MYHSGIKIPKRRTETLCITGKSKEEVVGIMSRLPRCADVEPEKVPETVTISDASMKDVVDIYALYQKTLLKHEVIEFTKSGRRKLWEEAS